VPFASTARASGEVTPFVIVLEQGNTEMLVTQAPVQRGKTLLASVWGSAWMLRLAPDVECDFGFVQHGVC
jgi:hypothetical protein